MPSQKFWHKNSKNVSCVLSDIRNYLEKLESGQMEIEACQWELQRDLTNLKCAIEGIRKLKQDIKEMTMNNKEAIELIRDLENKLEFHKSICGEKKSSTLSVRSEDDDDETDNSSKGYNRKKCYGIFPKKDKGLSDLDLHDCENEVEKHSKEKYCDKQIENDAMVLCADYKAKSNGKTARAVSAIYHEKKQSRKPDKAIMERYLKDSAKYINTHSSHYDSLCTSTIRSEPEHGIYWDEMQKKCNNLETIQKKTCSMESLEQNLKKKSILTKQFFCPKCLKSFAFKGECIRHQIQEHSRAKQKFYYKKCNNVPDIHCKINECGCTRVKKNTKNYPEAFVYSCSYCRKVTNSPEQLTAHIRKCRIISRSNLL